MRMIWVSRTGNGGEEAGDAVYDRRMFALLGDRHDVLPFYAARRDRWRQLGEAALQLSAPETFGFGGPADAARLADQIRAHGADAVVFSHEHLDRLAAETRALLGPNAPPFLSVRHNLTSDGMRSILSDLGPLADAYGALARRQEAQALSGDLFAALFAISLREQRLLQAISGRRDVRLTIPGAPPATPLAAGATLHAELVLTGTYGWFPKARDLRRFLRESAALGLPLHEDVTQLQTGEMRFGVITDRFVAGHKLKTAAYLMQNCIVLSYADVLEDFAFSPHAARFIHRIEHARDIAPVMKTLMQTPADEMRAAFASFKAEVAEAFSWPANVLTMEEALASVVATPLAALKRA
jgi:hypothetical protein